jgi:hypothetical protein
VKTQLRGGGAALGCSMNQIASLATFNELGPAQTLQQRLLAAGISASINDESKLERFWFMTPPLAAIHVEVPQKEYLRARRTIEEWNKADGALRDAVRCPDCGSSRIEFPQIPRKFIMPSLMRLFIWLRVVPNAYYCLECQCTWPPTVQKERELDILGFPRDSRFWHPEKATTETRRS